MNLTAIHNPDKIEAEIKKLETKGKLGSRDAMAKRQMERTMEAVSLSSVGRRREQEAKAVSSVDVYIHN